MLTAAEIRRIFLDFFQSKQHKIVPSAPIVLKNDPTLLFTNSGMVQFKDYFLGTKKPMYARVADTQKCLRVSGKHNDLEEVGVDTYHHTMFEMLGNWSFGDYFKEDAIRWAWELLTEVYKLPKDRLYVTVFEGDAREGLPASNVARKVWETLIDNDRILNGNKKDNFWEMGDQGPCGPCSEIHVDCRSEEERALIDGKTLVNADHPQVIEIWNNVFIQFNRKADGTLENLPERHVDTGMGFERLVRVLQGKTSNYDTDIFTPTIFLLEKLTNTPYNFSDAKQDIAFRVLADHIRAISFTIADGQLPSNTGAGYVIRRILRRAVRYYYSYLNYKMPLLHQLVDDLASRFNDVFPELFAQKDLVKRVIEEEEKSFLRTLESGIKRFNNLQVEQHTISGKDAFELFDTYGFPLDLTKLMAAENGWKIDEEGFNVYLNEQKNRGKQDAKKETGDWIILKDENSQFVGYDETETTAQVLRYRTVKIKDKTQFQMVISPNPFYAESGGQVGDAGILEFENEKIQVLDTKKENDLSILWIDKIPHSLSQYEHLNCIAKVDVEKRNLTSANHSGTHLLHAALRNVLGTHVQQKGSLVNSEYLRFDFSHFAKINEDEMRKIETIVNQKIRENIALQEERSVPIEEAKSRGAMALFGEKYGENVRVITFDKNYSVELCGGTHVKNTGNIGLCKVISEGSIASGIRRLEALTGEKAQQYFEEKEMKLNEISLKLKNPKDIVKSVDNLISENIDLKKTLEKYENQQAKSIAETIVNKAFEHNNIHVITENVEVENAQQLKNITQYVKQILPNSICMIGFCTNDKMTVAIAVEDNLGKSKNIHCGNLIKTIAPLMNGNGGGSAFYATATGSEVSAWNTVREKFISLI